MSEIELALIDAHYSDTLEAYQNANPNLSKEALRALSFGFRQGWRKRSSMVDPWEASGHEMKTGKLQGSPVTYCRLCGMLKGGEVMPCKSTTPATSSSRWR